MEIRPTFAIEKNRMAMVTAIVAIGLLSYPAAGAEPVASGQAPAFLCDEQGYVRHWLISALDKKPVTALKGRESDLRKQVIDLAIVPPSDAALGLPGPFDSKWRFYYPGENVFVEQSGFYHKLTVLNLYAVTELRVPSKRSLPANFWLKGTADLWVNGKAVTRATNLKHNPTFVPVELQLEAGLNRVAIRLQTLAARDTRFLVGLQLLKDAGGVAVCLPGPAEDVSKVVATDAWLRSVKAKDRQTLISAGPPPVPVSVNVAGKSQPWPAQGTPFTFDSATGFNLKVQAKINTDTLVRELEIPANQPSEPRISNSADQHRRDYILQVAKQKSDLTSIIARYLAGQPDAKLDEAVFEKSIKFIDDRNDCADFQLAAALRMYELKMLTQPQMARVKETALKFRYWSDEPGTDGMCFGSENHALLFHGCQLIAGRLFKNETFGNSGRTGTDVAKLGAERCRKWIEQTEKRDGFQEFLSSTYIPLTAAALMNVADFSGDPELSVRAVKLVDRIYRDLALQSFDGVNVAPQGRVYRAVLYPQRTTSQAMIYFANPAAEASYTGWLMFEASSPTYRPPTDVQALMEMPARKTYRHGEVEIALDKTRGYLLTSLQIPASFASGLKPGENGYQQHLWYATLGKACHVFVNHPGASFDLTMSRPGFWYGNGILPRLVQKENRLVEFFDIPESHPVQFTHAHWPSDTFQQERVGAHWAFGESGKGRIALWCSQPLQRHDDVLMNRELRAYGRQAAWLCLCEEADGKSFEQFVKRCEALKPVLKDGTVQLGGEKF